MNLGDVARKTVPENVADLSARRGGDLNTRNFIPHRVHEAIGVLGAVSVATACMVPGTVAARVIDRGASSGLRRLEIEHPTGFFTVEMDVTGSGSDLQVEPLCSVADRAQADARRSVRAVRRLEWLVSGAGRQAGGPPRRIALIGYGEVGQILAADLRAAGIRDLVTWDRLFPTPTTAPSRAAAAIEARIATSMAEAVKGCDLIISAVTAANCVAAAREAAGSISSETIYFDLNSVAPQSKRAAAAAIEAAGGRYIEAAVMSPIAPKRIGSPVLIGGPHAIAFEPWARQLGFSGIRVFDSAVGRASAAKMCRSVMIKGLEALFTESLLAARRHGVEQTVLESLRDVFPHEDWSRSRLT